MDISIGKFTLESLTTGMYNEPETCYREYIQNAVDSIDSAVEQGILSVSDSRIEIIVDDEHQTISIKDNGCGIKRDFAAKTLLDIGNSTKTHTVNRGFRGIGRLGGLSYCRKLSFCTSALGDNTKTIVTFDCESLRLLLIPGQNDDYTLQSVIERVTTITELDEQESAHYFIVKMDGVDDIETLLNIDMVKDYVCQVAPLPFTDRFFWGKQINKTLLEHEIPINEYPIFIGSDFESLKQIYKPYRLTLDVSSRTTIGKDEIYGLSFFEIESECGIIAYGWYADTDYLGTLADDRVSGIRIRVGNILIGSGKTLSPYFKESRFNNWVIGELYIISQQMFPNARRDDFERNDIFAEFERGVRSTVGSDVSEKIRKASKERNNPSQKSIKKAEKEIAKVERILTTGFNSTYEKEQIADNLETLKKEVRAISKNAGNEIVQKKTDLLARLDDLKTEVDESSNYKTKSDITSDFSKSEKKIVQAMLEVLTRSFERETVDSLYQEFLAEIKVKGKK